jgi:isoquinoline 1-oxidoreductase alpha subunit
MSTLTLLINGQPHAIAPDWQQERLLDLLREHFGLVSAKFGCGQGQCGACTVLVDGQPQRSCLLTAADLAGQPITTIEGLAAGGTLHPVQQAWLDEAVPQCGYCQAGQIVSTVALLRRLPRPAHADIDAALAGHLCRCGTQQRARRAVRRAAGLPPEGTA